MRIRLARNLWKIPAVSITLALSFGVASSQKQQNDPQEDRPPKQAKGSSDKDKSAGAATNAGQPLPLAAPRSAVARELEQLVAKIAGSVAAPKRKIFGLVKW